MYLRILAPIPVLEDGKGQEIEFPKGKAFALLAYLAIRNDAVARGELAELFWPDRDPTRQRGSLRQALWAIRNRLGSEILLGDDPIRLSPGVITLDLEVFRQRLSQGDWSGALELWGDPPFGQLEVGEAPEWNRWKDRIRLKEQEDFADRLTQEAGQLLRTPSTQRRGDGSGDDPIHLLRLATEVQPARLKRYEALIQALLERKHLDQARQVLEEARAVLLDPRSQTSLDSLESQRLLLERGTLPEDKRDLSIRLPFSGRADELGLLLQQWRAVGAGRTGVSMLLGESGVGKTRLANEVLTVAEREGGRIIQVKGEPTESPTVWGVLNDLVTQLLRLSGAGGISPVSDATLRNLGVESEPAQEPSRARIQGPHLHPSVALTDAIVDLVGAVSEDAPLLLFVDDLHWSDTESRTVLSRVVHQLSRDLPIQWIFASWDLDDAGRAATTLEQIAAPDFAQTIRLTPWSYPVMRDALQARITFRGDLALGRDVLGRIHAVTRGNPLFVIELLTVFVEEGIMTPQGEHFWAFDVESMPENFPLPASVRALVERHLSQLSEEAILIATTLARLGRPSPPRLLGTRAGLREAQVTAALGELLTRRMIRWTDQGTVDFLHDELRSAIALRVEGHIGLTSGGGKTWSWFRTVAMAAILLLILSGVVFWLAGPERMAQGPWDGGILVTLRGDEAPQAFTLRGVAGLTLRTTEVPDLAPIQTRAPLRVEPMDTVGGDPAVARVIYLPAGERDEVPLGTIPLPVTRLSLSPDHGALAVLSGPERGRLSVHLGGQWHISPEEGVEVFDLAWCGSDRLMVLGRRLDEEGLWEWRPGSSDPPRLVDLGTLLPGQSLACSPNGNAVVLAGAAQGRGGLFLYNTETGSLTRLTNGTGSGVPERIHWIPDRNPDGPTDIQIEGIPTDTVVLQVGSQIALHPTIMTASGEGFRGRLRWHVEHPELAELINGDYLQALRSGETVVRGTWGVGLGRSITLKIEDEKDPTLLAFFVTDGADTTEAASNPFALPAQGGATLEARVRWRTSGVQPTNFQGPRVCLQGVESGQSACLKLVPQQPLWAEDSPPAEDALSASGRLTLRTDPYFPDTGTPLQSSWIRPLGDDLGELRLLLYMDDMGAVTLLAGGATQLRAPIDLNPALDEQWEAILHHATDTGVNAEPSLWVQSVQVWSGGRR